VIELFGLRIHEPDVAGTDLILAIEAALFASLFLRHATTRSTARTLRVLLVVLFAALAASSLFGALYHAFFPTRATEPGGFRMWLLVTASIGTVAGALWCIDALFLQGAETVRRMAGVAALYVAALLYVVAFVSDRFSTIILFYLPPLLLLAVIALVRSLRDRSLPWLLVLAGIALALLAAALQLLQVGLHPVYFNHNAVYHVVQAVALAVMFFGFRGLVYGDNAIRR
jgi:hypothetical protein